MTRSKELFRTSAALAALLALGACSSDLSPTPDAESPALSAQATTVNYWILDSASDAEQLGSGNVLTASPVLELGTRSDGPQTVGLRFRDVNVPRGAVITEAYLQFQAVTNQSGAATLDIYGHDVGNAASFSPEAGSISARAKTAAKTVWTAAPFTDGGYYNSFYIMSIVQEITSRSDWTAGNAMAFMISGTGLRSVKAFDQTNSSLNTARLIVSYDPPPPPTSTCLNGKTVRTFTGGANAEVTNFPSGTAASLGSARYTGKDYQPGTPGALRRDKVPLWMIGNAANLCVSGGQLSYFGAGDDSKWSAGGAGILLAKSKAATIERVAIVNAFDGLAVWAGEDLIGTDVNHADNLKFNDSYIRHTNDEIIENDVKAPMTVDNVLADWTYTAVSCRNPGNNERNPAGAIYISDTLFALKTQRWGYKNPNTGSEVVNDYNFPFKWERTNPCPLYLNNVTIYMEGDVGGEMPLFDTNSLDTTLSFVKECRNVTLLYGGTEASYYAGSRRAQIDQLRTKFPGCLTVRYSADARSTWNARRQEWFNKLPSSGFAHIKYYQNRDPKPQ